MNLLRYFIFEFVLLCVIIRWDSLNVGVGIRSVLWIFSGYKYAIAGNMFKADLQVCIADSNFNENISSSDGII